MSSSDNNPRPSTSSGMVHSTPAIAPEQRQHQANSIQNLFRLQTSAGSSARRFATLFSPSLTSGLIPSPVLNSDSGNSRRISPRQSPYSLLPFGSPLTFSNRSVLNPVGREDVSAEAADASSSGEGMMTTKIRMRGRDLYGGRVMYGGTNNSSLYQQSPLNLRRHNRLLASTPYQSSMKQRTSNKHQQDASLQEDQPITTNSNNEVNKSDSSAMSSTARTILDTLEKMSTPVLDALKIPVPRAEKRRQLTEELLGRGSILSERRRPRLGGSVTSSPWLGTPDTSVSGQSARGLLNGPPLRTNLFSAVNANRLPNHHHRSPHQIARKTAESSNLSPLQPATSNQERNKLPDSSPRSSFSVPMTSSQSLKGPTSTTSASSVQGGKIRAKVTERAKTRAEKAVTFVDAYNDKDNDGDQVPSYLSGATSNPFAQLNSLPSFQFGQNNLGNKSAKEELIEQNQSILTSPILNKSNECSPPRKSAQQVMTSSSSTTKVMEKVFDTKSNKNCDTAKTSFVFSRPKELRKEKLGKVKKGDFSFSFSQPRDVKGTKRSNSSSSSSSGATLTFSGSNSAFSGTGMLFSGASFSSRQQQLPDLTAGAPLSDGKMMSSGNNGFSFGNSAGFSNSNSNSSSSFASVSSKGGLGGSPKVAMEMVKTGSVMDILGGKNKLPDVTAPAGLMPAKALKDGSVMDILGKNLGTDAWQPNFNLGKKPWH